MSSNARGGVAGSQPMSTAVHTVTKINFGDLTPYLTYAFRVALLSSSFFVHSMENIFDSKKINVDLPTP